MIKSYYIFEIYLRNFLVFIVATCLSCNTKLSTPEESGLDQQIKPEHEPHEEPFKNVKVESKEFVPSDEFWWPEQKAPNKLISCTVDHNNNRERILVESLAGIAAKAVNEGKNDEMVWITVGTPAAKEWFNRTVDRLAITEIQVMNVWELLNHLTNKGLVSGYVLYDYDDGDGQVYTKRNDINKSANVATSVASIINAAVVDRSLESKILDSQLVKLFDASIDMSYSEVYHHLKSAINNNLIMIVDPKAPHHRDIAIAQNTMVIDASSNNDLDYFFGKMTLSSPVLGWGFGDEFNFTSRASKAGLIITASNWCWNLPFLSADSKNYQVKKVKSLKPKEIDWNKDGHFHSFVMSDGDNMQWMELNFTHHVDYWANVNNGTFPFGWTTCAGQIAEMFPTTLDYISETQPNNVSIIDYGGGYHYPDLFGERTNTELALRKHAKKVNLHMKKNGVKVFGFLCKDLDSPEAKIAYQIYAEELEDLTGMIAVQYAPYEGGNGEIHWAIDRKGRHIPVVTSKYSLWANLNNERAGNPDKIASLINQEVVQKDAEQKTANSFTMVHAWSEFTNESGLTSRGLNPVKWTVDKLNKNITVVNTEEMLWRVRMTHYPNEVKNIINE